jgi:hypothetical protein
MSGPRRKHHVEYFKAKVHQFSVTTTAFLSRFTEGKRLDSIDYEFLHGQMAYIRGAAMRLRLPEIVLIGRLGEEIFLKIGASPSDAEAKALLVSVTEALATILKTLENPNAEPPVELVMTRFRFESLLENLSN